MRKLFVIVVRPDRPISRKFWAILRQRFGRSFGRSFGGTGRSFGFGRILIYPDSVVHYLEVYVKILFVSGTRFSPIWSRQDLTLPYLQNDACGGFFLHKCHLGCLFGLFFYLEEWLAAGPSLFLLVGICGMTTVPYTIKWSSCLAADQLPKLGYLPQLLPMLFIMGKQMPSPLIPIWKRAPLPIFRIVFYRQYYKNVFESYGLAFETYWIPLHEDNSEAAFDPLVLLKVSLKIGLERTANIVSILKRPLIYKCCRTLIV